MTEEPLVFSFVPWLFHRYSFLQFNFRPKSFFLPLYYQEKKKNNLFS